jgi:arylsulfatase A-like enzyme
MFTGAFASRTGADWRSPLGEEQATLAEVLAARGLVTGGFVANTVAAWYRTGLARGFTRYDDTPRTFEEVLLSTTLTQTKSVVNSFIEWKSTRWPRATLQALAPLSLRPHGNYLWNDDIPAEAVVERFLEWEGGLEGRPFFAFLNFFDAHAPYLPPPPYRAMYGAGGRVIDRYLGAIRYMDDELDALLRTLDRRGRLENTIVIVTSDHGESFGEHDLAGHGNGLYRDQIRVPLLILNAPGLPQGTRVTAPVSLRDLAATIADLTGVAEHPFGGQSLRRLVVQGERGGLSPSIAEVSRSINANPRSFVGRADQKSVVDDSLHVIASSLGTLAVYDIRTDPLEKDDRCDEGARCDAARALLSRVLGMHRIVW